MIIFFLFRYNLSVTSYVFDGSQLVVAQRSVLCWWWINWYDVYHCSLDIKEIQLCDVYHCSLDLKEIQLFIYYCTTTASHKQFLHYFRSRGSVILLWEWRNGFLFVLGFIAQLFLPCESITSPFIILKCYSSPATQTEKKKRENLLHFSLIRYHLYSFHVYLTAVSLCSLIFLLLILGNMVNFWCAVVWLERQLKFSRI